MNTQFTCWIIGIFLTFYLGGILILLADKETPTKRTVLISPLIKKGVGVIPEHMEKMTPITLVLFCIYKLFLVGEVVGGMVVFIFLDLPIMEFGIYLSIAVLTFLLPVLYMYFPLMIVQNTRLREKGNGDCELQEAKTISLKKNRIIMKVNLLKKKVGESKGTVVILPFYLGADMDGKILDRGGKPHMVMAYDRPHYNYGGDYFTLAHEVAKLDYQVIRMQGNSKSGINATVEDFAEELKDVLTLMGINSNKILLFGHGIYTVPLAIKVAEIVRPDGLALIGGSIEGYWDSLKHFSQSKGNFSEQISGNYLGLEKYNKEELHNSLEKYSGKLLRIVAKKSVFSNGIQKEERLQDWNINTNRKLIALDMDEHMAVCYGSINTEGIFAVVDTLERPGLYPKLMESIKVWLEEE